MNDHEKPQASASTSASYDAYFEGCRARGVLPCSRESFDADQASASVRVQAVIEGLLSGLDVEQLS